MGDLNPPPPPPPASGALEPKSSVSTNFTISAWCSPGLEQDLLITNQLLYQLSYGLSGLEGNLNSRPDDYKSTALPTELCQHIYHGEGGDSDPRYVNLWVFKTSAFNHSATSPLLMGSTEVQTYDQLINSQLLYH